jgi:hypothetical protein
MNTAFLFFEIAYLGLETRGFHQSISPCGFNLDYLRAPCGPSLFPTDGARRSFLDSSTGDLPREPH